MPTLHLIDADSTQACPAVFSAIRAAMATSGDADDCLLILGGRSILEDATRTGVDRVYYLPVPFGKAVLGQHSLRRWSHARPDFTRIHCWSPGAMRAASNVFKDRDRQLSLVHTPTVSHMRRLARASGTNKHAGVRVLADNPALARRLQDRGVRCDIESVAPAPEHAAPMSDEVRRSIREGWGIRGLRGLRGDHERVVMLLSDHPQLANAVEAASVVALGCATLTDRQGEPMRILLLMHPRQLNRQRAGAILNDQPVIAHILQDARVSQPWSVLGACDAALALGPDAGGLSLRLAVKQGVPVVASGTGPAGALDRDTPDLILARSAMHKDLSHELHGALSVDV